MVYVPCTAPPPPGSDSFDVQFLRTGDDQIALPVYSALDRLVHSCGPDQPWVVLPTEKLNEVAAEAPFDLLLLDVEIPEPLRRMAGD